jgi:enterochelin esterase-like enzyme
MAKPPTWKAITAAGCYTLPVQRRQFFGASVALLGVSGRAARAASPESSELTQHDLMLDGDKRIARRALVLAPKHVPTGTKLPVLVLLHGLGETGNELLGIHAWGERYGAVRAYERLRRPPVQKLYPKYPWLDDERLAALNAALGKRAFGGLVLVCPVTPNPHKVGPAARTLDRYADFIERTLLPAVYDKVPCLTGPAHTGLDGCSLGGYVGVEVFLRKPKLFGTFGGVQAAFNVPSALRYAERIQKLVKDHGARSIRAGTSSEDPFRKANQAFAKELEKRGVPCELSVPKGPHNQPWLREIGTLEMLLWHERKLAKK